MLEILLLRFLLKRLGDLLRGKGRNAIGLQVMFVIGWMGGEVTGFIFGISRGMETGPMYVCALLGATVGAGTVFAIAAMLKPTVPLGHDVQRVFD